MSCFHVTRFCSLPNNTRSWHKHTRACREQMILESFDETTGAMWMYTRSSGYIHSCGCARSSHNSVRQRDRPKLTVWKIDEMTVEMKWCCRQKMIASTEGLCQIDCRTSHCRSNLRSRRRRSCCFGHLIRLDESLALFANYSDNVPVFLILQIWRSHRDHHRCCAFAFDPTSYSLTLDDNSLSRVLLLCLGSH